MISLDDVHETLIANLPAGTKLVLEPNATRPFDPQELQQLHVLEQKVCDGAVATRQRDFARGRKAAHEALEQLGLPESDGIGVSAAKAPLWPSGVVGSISHCDVAVAAVVAHAAQLRGIGLDVEVDQDMEPGAIDAVLRADEERIDSLVQFSAKESMYKAWEPIMGQWLDFSEVSVQPVRLRRQPLAHLFRKRSGLTSGELGITFHRDVPQIFRNINGCWVRGASVVATAVWLPRD
ncbi:MAG: 4'-phosphopantetheinyl transferase superfamily protein [Corynebacterium sp.]|uniref:4'-phosphopantetheinyl transferase family protein n=1 Tax=Corynebacterium sp. TaxID=1720 RepID=UPI0026DD2597|nr:4'-phosphopantetheinyl transferase superfamily protein [Corynebacterium sp.]MDO5029256.1 4'-phosphopantetheinyl transferase superfamily protein [Corynebacterium sp.]